MATVSHDLRFEKKRFPERLISSMPHVRIEAGGITLRIDVFENETIFLSHKKRLTAGSLIALAKANQASDSPSMSI